LRSGDDDVAQLDGRGATEFHGTVTRDAQQPDRFDDPVGLLWGCVGLAGLEQSGGDLGVDRVALANAPASVSVGLVDLDDLHVMLAQVAHERYRVGAGRLDRDHIDLSKAAQPVQQLAVARRCRREAVRREQRSALIQRGCVMGVCVRVDPANNNRSVLRHAVHAVPSLS